MKIKSINIISYGKFNNKKIDFSDGLNVVYGGNEAGKSTLMSFIKSMLYGFTSTRASDISQNDRKKYMPWDGKNLSGEIDVLTDGGKSLRISRISGKSQSFDTAECFDIANSESYTFVPDNEIGISEDAFLKTFYIKQLGTKISGENEEIAQKLINLTHNASEDVSFGDAIDKIRAEMKRYKALKGGGGLITLLQNRLTELNNELSKAEEKRLKNFESAEKKKRLEFDISKYRVEIDSLIKLKETAGIQEKYERHKDYEEKINKYAEDLAKAEADKAETEKYISENQQYETAASDVIYLSREDTEHEEKTLEKLQGKKYFIPLIIALFFITSLFTVTYFLTQNTPVSVIGFFITALISFALYSYFVFKRKKEILKAQDELKRKTVYNSKITAELSKYGVSSFKEYNEKMYLFKNAKAKVSACSGTIAEIRRNIAESQAALGEIDLPESYVPIKIPFSLAETERKLEETRNELENAVAEEARIGGVLSAEISDGRTTDVILTAINDVRTQLDEASCEYEALNLTAKCLEEAYAQMNSDYTPVINKRASEILRRITGGKYNELYLDKKYSVKLIYDGTKNLGYFSSGTCDAVYFCVRLAVADTLFGFDKPIFIDDGFTQYDEEREENAVNELLRRADEGQQIIMFTCRHPQNLPINSKVNIITL